MKNTKYEVYIDCVYGSDVLTFDNEQKACEEAEKWAEEIEHRYRVVVVRVEEEIVRTIHKRRF